MVKANSVKEVHFSRPRGRRKVGRPKSVEGQKRGQGFFKIEGNREYSWKR